MKAIEQETLRQRGIYDADEQFDETVNSGEDEDVEEDPIQLSASTHDFLFTEPTFSLPFCFAIAVVTISYTTLLLATTGGLSEGTPGNIVSVPANVSTSVRITQFIALVIGLIMEEEIPNSLYLLRSIPRESLHRRFPRLSYGRFIGSLIVRLVMGYLFLINMFIVVARADEVIGIFYDVLALQFIQQLDDISFSLAKIDVFGRRLKAAACKKYFRAEFDKVPFAKRRRVTLAMKILYFVHLFLLLFGMATISVRQMVGSYHPESITVTFRDDTIWANALVLTPEGGVKERTLIYSWFNGVYERNGTMQDGRPVYFEMNKYEDAPYNEKVPAEIKYCDSERAWVISHRDIVRKDPGIKDSEFESNQLYCAWILKSQETSKFDFLSVPTTWNIWKGSLEQTEVQTMDNECKSEVDCNYNGQCIEGKCQCHSSLKEFYFGTHCEVKIDCVGIASDDGGTWYLSEGEGGFGTPPISLYGRPAYYYENNTNPNITVGENDTLALIYSGSRYFAMSIPKTPTDDPYTRAREYHAFWDEAYNNYTLAVSDSTTSASPIGTDFYWIGKRGERYGPYGQLYPLSEPAGSGAFYCNLTLEAYVEYLYGYVGGDV